MFRKSEVSNILKALLWLTALMAAACLYYVINGSIRLKILVFFMLAAWTPLFAVFANEATDAVLRKIRDVETTIEEHSTS